MKLERGSRWNRTRKVLGISVPQLFVLSSLGLCFLPGAMGIAQAAQGPDWSEGAAISPQGRANIYNYNPEDLQQHVQKGRINALVYPVEVTGELVPYQALQNFLSDKTDTNVLRNLLRFTFTVVSRIKVLDDVVSRLNLHAYPLETDTGVYAVPYPENLRPSFRMGTSVLETSRGNGLTFGCATCHVGQLFGKKVLGMANRFPRANEFFIAGKAAVAFVDPHVFQAATRATDAEREMFSDLRENSKYIEGKKPLALGLDTSLAQVALSLSHRAPDPLASRSAASAAHPRASSLRSHLSDSKPAVLWNVKYKNRFLLDGSVVSGNPIFTNFIWNEIGRGTDLEALQNWFKHNTETVENLTAAVFATEAPRYTDFFPAEKISEDAARHGQELFNGHCASCHGSYEKGWQRSDAAYLTPVERLATVKVSYHERTPVIDVGTDLNRANGMVALESGLNGLALSKANGVVVKVQQGYVPPPLVGVWARFPYFHNNSAPSLCAVLTQAAKRPRAWYAGEPLNRSTDFDDTCNGYPLGDRTPSEWKKNKAAFMDTSREGLGNQGHDEGLFLNEGKEIFSQTDKSDLIAYLKTL